MLTIQMLLAAIIVINLLWPELPVSRSMTAALLRMVGWVQRNATLGRALVGVSAALFLFALVWALQGDAPMFMAMILPELAAWFATFEIMTLVDALIGVGSAIVAVRSAGLRAYLRTKFGARRRRSRKTSAERKPANDDDRPAVQLPLAA